MFKLILTNGKDNKELVFSVRDTAIAKKWFLEIQKNYPLYETERFTNWGNSDTINLLNDCIEEINNYENIIDKIVSSSTTQQDLNYLHKFFEDLRGEVSVGTDWFNAAPKNVKNAVERFNILIHQLEEEIRSKNYPTLVVTFKDRPRFELSAEDIKHFTFNWTKGTVYINYCHVGKPVLDVFKDRDKIAEGIRPQTHYSADFMIKFGPSTSYPLFILRKLVIKTWLLFQKFDFKNPNIGYIPVADLVGEFNLKSFEGYTTVKEVQCIE
jgi:hypothetical protein